LVNKDDGKVAKLRAAGDKRREDQLKSRNIAKKNEDAAGVAESDPSGLMHAARHLNKEFRITAEVDGVAKRTRVQAQSSRTAQEKFMKRYPTAQIHNVEDITQQMSETGVAEGQFDTINDDDFYEYNVNTNEIVKRISGKHPIARQFSPMQKEWTGRDADHKIVRGMYAKYLKK